MNFCMATVDGKWAVNLNDAQINRLRVIHLTYYRKYRLSPILNLPYVNQLSFYDYVYGSTKVYMFL